MYRITGTVVHNTTNKDCVTCNVTYQVPTFELNETTHGIRSSDHAEEIARKIICPMASELQYESVEVHLHAEKV